MQYLVGGELVNSFFSAYCLTILVKYSAFVGLATILLLFPAPGYVAKRIQGVQEFRLKATDARVQTVTESGLQPIARCSHLTAIISNSYECIAHDQVVRMGKEDGPEDS
jgi:hypothetical protein